MIGRNDGVVGPDADQHSARDVRTVVGLDVGEARVEPDDRLDVRARAPEFERKGAPEAVADDGDPALVDERLAAPDVERGDGERYGAVGVVEEFTEATHHLVSIGERAELTVVVEREPDVAELSD